MSVRSSAVAGIFYPSDPRELHSDIEDLLQHADLHNELPKAIIAPHAGYTYSGPIAANAYSSFYNQQVPIERIILIGPAHRVSFGGIAASSADYFSTPLGEVPVDHDSLSMSLSNGSVKYIDAAHEQEHCLEVHLPFMQHIFEQEFKIVPLVIGQASASQVAGVLRDLWGGSETLVVVSSDLSHYHDYETAKVLDKQTTSSIEKFHGEELNYESACGRVPIQGLLIVAKEKGLQCMTVDLRNSGDTMGSHDRVVGYGAYAFC